MGKDASSTQWVACMSSSLSAMQLQQGCGLKGATIREHENRLLILRTHNATGKQQCHLPPHAGGMPDQGGGVRSSRVQRARERVAVEVLLGERLGEAAQRESLR